MNPTQNTAKQKVRLSISPQAEKYVRGDAPVMMRRMAARAAVPLPPIDLVTVLFALLHDTDEEARTSAKKSLVELPDSICTAVLAGDTSPVVLSYLAKVFQNSPERTELIALNAATDDATIAFLATLPHRRVIEIIAQNQTRMLRYPPIVDALGNNPNMSRAMIDRVLSFLGLDRPKDEVADPADTLEVELQAETITDENAEAALRALLGDDTSEFDSELIEESEGEATDSKFASLAAQIQGMSVFQKIKLARMGNKEARSILIREHNKLIAASAIRSPKITDSEVAGYAKQRGLSDEVYRIIAANREWTQKYPVKLALVTNPKCPISTAMKFLNHLQDKDLKVLSKSRDVSGAVSTQAKRLLAKKGKA